MVGVRDSAAFHRNTDDHGRPLSAQEREKLLKPFLPGTPDDSRSPSMSPARRPPKAHRRKPMRDFLKAQLHLLIYTVVHAAYSLYVRIRRAYHAVVDHVQAVLYYHHRTPELIQNDVKRLEGLPEHLSVILEFEDDEKGGAGLDGLVNDISEIAAWCASAGIPCLSVYEKTGILKNYLPQTHQRINKNLQAYFGAANKPTLSLRAPHQPTFSPPTTPPSPFPSREPAHLSVLLLSAEDGRSTIVDLTKVLAQMAQKGNLSPSDISSEVIDAELSDSVMSEPNLLIMFGERLVLDGYPPWQLRLTEIFHARDNTEGVCYQVFLRALYRYAKAEMRFGR